MADRPTHDRPVRTWPKLLLVAALVVGALSLVFSPAIIRLLWVEGTEFSADQFRRRQFSYGAIPGLNIQVWPIQRQDATRDLEQYLQLHRLIPATDQPGPRWDLAAAYRGGQLLGYGDAQILCNYLDMRDAGSNLWLTWSKDQPELAAVLWPAVARLARQEHYALIPRLMDAAAEAETPDEFEAEIRHRLAAGYRELAELHRALGKPERAEQLSLLAAEAVTNQRTEP